MTKRIFRSILLAAIAVLLASLTLVMGAMYSYFTSVQFEQLRVETALAAHAVTNEGLDYFEDLDGTMDCRITWIAADGTVLYDNSADSDSMENHLERQEVVEALRSGYGQSSRYSATLLQQSMYAAELLPDGTVLRLSASQSSVLNLTLGILQDIILILVIAVILSLSLARRLSRRIVQPLNELNLDNPLSGDGYEEVTPLLQRIASQQRQLADQKSELKRKQREFDAVANNMNEGLVLMTEQCNVLTMNSAAARIMGLIRPYTGINFLTLDKADSLETVIRTALEGSHAEQIVRLPIGDYQIAANPVRSGGKVSGLVLLMFDITQKYQLELQRREFTANVSHELKSPLHAISGYAELLKSGMVPASDVEGFSESIYTEAQRMVRLIEDILKLSRLDENSGSMSRETVDPHRFSGDILRELKASAEKSGVSLTLVGNPCQLETIPHLLTGIVTNLCTNAIKYNRPGGSVRVETRETTEDVVLTVADTGIGIPPEHHERIFERFYLVDKSHSKAVGGTGLGLSIVKHAAMILNARIELQSAEGTGTTITVHFPKSS